MSTDVKQQVIAEIRFFPMFAVQFDESTDVALCLQLLAFVRYIHKEDVKEELLYGNSLELNYSNNSAQNVMNIEQHLKRAKNPPFCIILCFVFNATLRSPTFEVCS